MKNREKITKYNNSKNHTKIIKRHERIARIFVPICVNCVYCVNCTKFGQLILRTIFKIDATRRQIFRPKCTKIVFGWSCALDPAGGASLQRSPDPLAGLKGAYF